MLYEYPQINHFRSLELELDILDLAIFRNGSFSKFVVLSIVDICAKLQTFFQKLTIVKSKFTNPLSYTKYIIHS